MIDKFTSLARSSLIYGLGNYGVKLVGFLLIPVYTRYLLPADYGVMALVAAFGQALFIFLNLGQSTALFRFYYDDDSPEGRQRVIAGSLWIALVVSTPITLLALMLSGPTASLLLGDTSMAGLVAVGILTVACRQLLRLPFAVLRADDRQFGLVVERVHDTEEIVVKPLQKQLKGIGLYAGATIMGDGTVALILDVMGLAQQAHVVAGARQRSPREEAASVERLSNRQPRVTRHPSLGTRHSQVGDG